MDAHDRSAIITIYQAMQNAGHPLSRLEILQAIAGERIPDMGRILETMLKEGMLGAKEKKSANNTSTFCYHLKEGFDFDQWQSAAQ